MGEVQHLVEGAVIMETIKREVVVFNCCDMGNEGLGNKLGITPDKPWYEHPDFPGEKIFFFYDIPHLLKLLRNHLLNEGFILPSGTPIGKFMFDIVKERVFQGGDITAAWKLRDPHIWQPRSMDKQRVHYAAKLLSKTMANFIKFNFADDPKMLELADFVEAVNNLFDTLNSTKDWHPYPHKRPFGKNLDVQRQTLLDCKNLFENIRVMNVRNATSDEIKFQPWQKGILIACTGFSLFVQLLNVFLSYFFLQQKLILNLWCSWRHIDVIISWSVSSLWDYIFKLKFR